ncbi:MAG: 50S ribosomal protein L25 [Nitriliruptorales bacterium]|nr:50S ribosomal protein L25 [Nitriliruptorales bacterium]
MADQVALAARPRPGKGKGEARALRREGKVPAVAYGAGLEAIPVWVDALELYHALHTDAGENAIIALSIGDGAHLALARDLQRHPVRRDVLHVDFVTVSRTVKVTVEVPIVLRGEAPGVDEGGIAEQSHYALQIEVLPLEVPDQLVVDISEMSIGDVKRVADISLPDEVAVLDHLETPVVSIVVPHLEVPEEEVEGEEAEAAEAEDEGATAEEAPEPTGAGDEDAG